MSQDHVIAQSLIRRRRLSQAPEDLLEEDQEEPFEELVQEEQEEPLEEFLEEEQEEPLDGTPAEIVSVSAWPSAEVLLGGP